MINESLCCPSCGHCGYICATGAADLEELVATVCHYCGHILDRDELAECLALGKAAATQASSNSAGPSPSVDRSPRRSRGRG